METQERLVLWEAVGLVRPPLELVVYREEVELVEQAGQPLRGEQPEQAERPVQEEWPELAEQQEWAVVPHYVRPFARRAPTATMEHARAD